MTRYIKVWISTLVFAVVSLNSTALLAEQPRERLLGRKIENFALTDALTGKHQPLIFANTPSISHSLTQSIYGF